MASNSFMSHFDRVIVSIFLVHTQHRVAEEACQGRD